MKSSEMCFNIRVLSLLLNIQTFSEEFLLKFSETAVLKILEIPWKMFMVIIFFS